MPAESGVNVLLKVGNGLSPETFTTLEGQQSGTFGGNTEVADTTDKSNDGWKSGMPTLLDGTVQVSGVVKWDASFERLQTVWRARGTVNCQLVLNEDGDYESGAFRVTNFQITGEVRDATRYDITLMPDGALTRVAGP